MIAGCCLLPGLNHSFVNSCWCHCLELPRKYFLPIFLVGFTTLRIYAQPPAASDHWSVLQLVEYHQHLRPKMQVQDVYKLLYQANFGVEHLLTDTAGARKYLFDELATMDTTIHGEQLIERISPTEEIVRINLRPFRRLKLDPNKLISVMFNSASKTKPDTEEFYHDWSEFTSLVRYDFMKFSRKDVEEWDARVSVGDLEPVHHSRQYSDSYKPAYRVVRLSVFESTFQTRDLEASTEERRK
jgi:hypothetical protein